METTIVSGRALVFAVTSSSELELNYRWWGHGRALSHTGSRLSYVPDIDSSTVADTLRLEVRSLSGSRRRQEVVTRQWIVGANRPPAVAGLTPRVAHIGLPFTSRVETTDADGDRVFVFLLRGPPAMRLAPDGQLTWTPPQGSSGRQPLLIRASDSFHTVDVADTITVLTDAAKSAAALPPLVVYPNPFVATTTFLLHSSPAQPASTVSLRLRIYDISGQVVYEHTQLLAPSSNCALVLYWDGVDRAGRQAASGVYLYALQQGDQPPVTGKILLMR